MKSESVCRISNDRHRLFLFPLLALLLGLGWMAVMTPLSVPDEEYHYRTAYCLSNYLLGQGSEPLLGWQGYFDFTGFLGHFNVSSGYERVARDLTAPMVRGELIPVLGTLPDCWLLMYFPQVLGLTLARAFGANFVTAFYAGRLCNLLFYVFCLTLSLRLAPGRGTLLGTAALVPMALHQAASWSYDGYVNGLALVYLGALFRCMSGEGDLPKRDMAALTVCAVLLAPAKGGCFPLLLLSLLIPGERFGGRRRKAIRLGALLLCCALLLSAVLAASSDKLDSHALNWEGEHNYSLAFVLAHPGETARIFARTLRYELRTWLRGALGGAVSGLTLILPARIPVCAGAMVLLAASWNAPEETPFGKKTRLAFLAAAAGMVFLAMAVMFLTWTSDTRRIIQGVQGRYFIPAIPVTAAALGLPLRPRSPIPAWIPCALMTLIHCDAFRFIVLYTLAH